MYTEIEGTYYWYGENKAYTDLEKRIWLVM